MILLLWVYYSCQILLLGAEFTRVYAEHRGATVDPQLFAGQGRRTQPGNTGNRLDVTRPASATT
jgi:membrane protein